LRGSGNRPLRNKLTVHLHCRKNCAGLLLQCNKRYVSTGSKYERVTPMKHVALNAMILGLAVVAAPCNAAIVVQTDRPDDAAAVFTVDSTGWEVAPPPAPVATSDPIDTIGTTLTSYAAMLPVPADWILLVTGFGVIGYAMRSRKRSRVSFN
jgi:hypothetical protein